jgi:DNA-binding MurR/RpiR family transcriptional regulator
VDIPEEGKEIQTLVQVWKQSVELLDKSLDEELMESFGHAIDTITNSSHINVFGTRPYKATALYFEQLLGEFYSKIRQLSHDTETIYDKILQIEKDEILIVFAFEPYTNVVMNVVKRVYEQGNRIILITDHISCPVISYATVTLRVAVGEEQFSILSIIALIDALIIEIGKRSSEKSIKKLKELEETLKKEHVTFTY